MIGRIRSGGYGYTLGQAIGYTYLPVEEARVGTPLTVDLLGEHVAAVVANGPPLYTAGAGLRT